MVCCSLLCPGVTLKLPGAGARVCQEQGPFLELSTSASAKYSNIKHPYDVVQNFTTGPCGEGVAINCLCPDHKGCFEKKKLTYQQVQPASAAFQLLIPKNGPWSGSCRINYHSRELPPCPMLGCWPGTSWCLWETWDLDLRPEVGDHHDYSGSYSRE